MGCKCSCNIEIMDEQKKNLLGLAEMENDCCTKDISAATAIEGKSPSSHLKTLKTKGDDGSQAR